MDTIVPNLYSHILCYIYILFTFYDNVCALGGCAELPMIEAVTGSSYFALSAIEKKYNRYDVVTSPSQNYRVRE